MNWLLKEKHLVFQQEIRQYLQTINHSHIHNMHQHNQFPHRLLQEMGKLGYMGIPLPEKYGGKGKDFLSYILALEEISRVSSALAVIIAVHTSLVTLPLFDLGTSEQKASFLPRLVSGEWLGAFALTEDVSGSDAGAMRTEATLKNGQYVLQGSKLFITNAKEAQFFLTFVKVNSGITAFLLEREREGVHIGKTEGKMGMHGSSTCEVILDQVAVPIFNRLGNEGEGFSLALSRLSGGRIGIAAQALGIVTQAVELMRSKGHIYAEWSTQLEAAKLLVYRAALCHQKGLSCRKEAAMAKQFTSDLAMRVTSEALTHLGWCSDDLFTEMERLFRDAKVTQIYEGTNEIQRIVIAKELLKKR